MGTDRDDTTEGPGEEGDAAASLHIEAPAEQLWDMVADVTRMGEWSPECYRCRWFGREKQPVPGARFVGFNKRGIVRWATPNVVQEAERGKVFSFQVVGSKTIWGYRFQPEGTGTRVTEFRQLPAKRPLVARIALVLMGGAASYASGVPDKD